MLLFSVRFCFGWVLRQTGEFACWRWKPFVPPPLCEGGGVNESLTRAIKAPPLRIRLANAKAASVPRRREQRHGDTRGLKCWPSGVVVWLTPTGVPAAAARRGLRGGSTQPGVQRSGSPRTGPEPAVNQPVNCDGPFG